MTRDEFLKTYGKNRYGKYSVTLMKFEFKDEDVFFAYFYPVDGIKFKLAIMLLVSFVIITAVFHFIE